MIHAQINPSLIQDAGVLLNADFGILPGNSCNSKVFLVSPIHTYDCECDKDLSNPERKNIVVPKKHPLHKKHGIQLVSLGTEFSAINDNHLGHFVGMTGDDSGNTWGADLGLSSKLESFRHKINVGLNYQLRQFTKPLEGVTNVNSGGLTTWVEDENGVPYILSEQEGSHFQNEYGNVKRLHNQASVSFTMLRVDMMLENKNQKSKTKISYGGGLGYKTLNDTNNQYGAIKQDSHHKSGGMYRFNWMEFNNLIVDGVEEYLFVEPKVRFEFPKLVKGKCSLESSSEFSVLFNTPIANGSNSLNLIEPKARVDMAIGLLPLKKDKSLSRFSLFNSISYDPFNQVNAFTDSGYDAFSQHGLQINGKVGKRINYYIIPIEFYIPIGGNNGGVMDQKVLHQNGNELLATELEKDILATWGESRNRC